MVPSQDTDTRPRSPFQNPPSSEPAQSLPENYEPEPESGGVGCMVWGFLGVMVLGLAGLIVALSGLAGWTSGQRTAQGNATATQNAVIMEQLERIPLDLNEHNLVLAEARLRFLATLTPGVPGTNDLALTATAVFINIQPTATSMPTATPQPEATLDASPPLVVQPEATLANGFDPAAILAEARAAAALQDWDEVISLLDVVIGLDSSFESLTVRSLMSQALNAKALALFRSGEIAEAIIVTGRAEEFGAIGELDYERYIGGLYLDALNTIGTSYPAAIQALTLVYSQVPTYRDVGALLFNQYVAYGDAWTAQSEHCPAVAQYQNALTILQDVSVVAKRDNATTMCSQATPVGAPPDAALTPGAPGIPTATFAPVGVGS